MFKKWKGCLGHVSVHSSFLIVIGNQIQSVDILYDEHLIQTLTALNWLFCLYSFTCLSLVSDLFGVPPKYLAFCDKLEN